jgi:hypothetical protein
MKLSDIKHCPVLVADHASHTVWLLDNDAADSLIELLTRSGLAHTKYINCAASRDIYSQYTLSTTAGV